MPRKKSQHYVNNKEFLAAMTDYKNSVKKVNILKNLENILK